MRFHPRSVWCGLVAALAAIAAAPSPVQAQQLTGSVFGGPAVVRNIGNHDSAWQAGGGAERLAGRFGFGGEARYVYFPEATRTFEGRVVSSSPAVGAPAVSFRGAYYWPRDRAARLQPFVSAGLTYLFDNEMPVPMLHLGGGTDWWTTSRAGLRFEVREEFPSILSFRGGVVFR